MSATEMKAAIILLVAGLYIGRVVMKTIKQLNNFRDE